MPTTGILGGQGSGDGNQYRFSLHHLRANCQRSPTLVSCLLILVAYFLFVGRTMTNAPLKPGTAPRTRSRLFSASTPTTFKLRIVTRSLPYRPGSFLPRFRRPLPRLLAIDDVEPGSRWTFLAP